MSQHRHALRIATAERKSGEHADERRQHRKQQQPTAGRRQHGPCGPVVLDSVCTGVVPGLGWRVIRECHRAGLVEQSQQKCHGQRRS